MATRSKRWKKLKSILPPYAWIPFCSTLVLSFAVFYGSRSFTNGRFHYLMQTPIDDRIPFLSWFVIFYILAYVQWGIGFFMIGRESEEVCCSLVSAEMIAKVIGLACFLLIPTTIIRPAVTGHSVFDELVRRLYAIDPPDNLFPSLHCLDSWICLRSCRYLKKTPAWYFPLTLIVTTLVFLSTVMIKQHYVVDMAGAVLAAEAGLSLSRLFKTGRLFAKINMKLMGKRK